MFASQGLSSTQQPEGLCQIQFRPHHSSAENPHHSPHHSQNETQDPTMAPNALPLQLHPLPCLYSGSLHTSHPGLLIPLTHLAQSPLYPAHSHMWLILSALQVSASIIWLATWVPSPNQACPSHFPPLSSSPWLLTSSLLLPSFSSLSSSSLLSTTISSLHWHLL